MSTPGRRKALKKLASRKRSNRNRVAEGKKPKLNGRTVSLKTFNKKTGANMSKCKAKGLRNQARRRGN